MTQDVVAVFDSEFVQLFPQARTMKAMVLEAASIATHPVESGGTIADNRIFLPVEIELSMILAAGEFRQVYQQIKSAFFRNDLLTVQTKTASYGNMMIEAMPYDEVPEMFDTIALALKLREIRLVTAQFQALPPVAVQNRNNAGSVARGEQSPREGGSRASILYRNIYGTQQ